MKYKESKKLKKFLDCDIKSITSKELTKGQELIDSMVDPDYLDQMDVNILTKARIKKKIRPLMPESAYNYFVKWFDDFQVVAAPRVRFYKGEEFTKEIEVAFDEIVFGDGMIKLMSDGMTDLTPKQRVIELVMQFFSEIDEDDTWSENDLRTYLNNGGSMYEDLTAHTAEDELTVHGWEHMSEEDKRAWCESQPNCFPATEPEDEPKKRAGTTWKEYAEKELSPLPSLEDAISRHKAFIFIDGWGTKAWIANYLRDYVLENGIDFLTAHTEPEDDLSGDLEYQKFLKHMRYWLQSEDK